jgi:ribonuclease HI
VVFDLGIGATLPVGASAETRRKAAAFHLASLPQCATWAWTDGSATGGVLDGGAGGFIAWPDGATHELRAPAGRLCSSFRAEMVALRETLTYIHNHPAHEEDPIIICTDSQAALSALRSGPAEQRTQLNRAVWDALTLVADHGERQVRLQWVPSHCGLPGNETADNLAKEAASLPKSRPRWTRARSTEQQRERRTLAPESSDPPAGSGP